MNHRLPHNWPEPEPTIRVVMLRTDVGYPQPGSRVTYEAGQEYDLPESLAACFFSTASADPAEAHQQPSEPIGATLDGQTGAGDSIPANPSRRRPSGPRKPRAEA
jgi:hypothetical protein